MHTLIFATNNQHKADEIKIITQNRFNILTLKEAGINIDIPEPHDSLKDNATEKSRTIFSLTHQNCFSEDTGLEVAALDRAPGVKSARYAGEEKSSLDNIKLLLHNLNGSKDRSAKFRTVISLIWNQQEYFFEGVCEGKISLVMEGNDGFGYDPVFIPDGSDKTFAAMTMLEKNIFSHRRKATDQLIHFLKNQ